jgi:hypothetical protein
MQTSDVLDLNDFAIPGHVATPPGNTRVRRAIDYANTACDKAFATGFANLESAAQS